MSDTTSIDLAKTLDQLPEPLVDDLVTTFSSIVTNYRERRWEPSALNGGKFCEVVYSILRGYVDGSFPNTPQKPPNMVDACRALEQAPSALPRSVRIQIPRMLLSLYEIRSNRGVGHVGGDVDPNHMDAVAVVAMTKWILAELVRVFHGCSTERATTIVDSLAEREVPLIWEVMGRRRVLRGDLTAKNRTLLLLYGTSGPQSEGDLAHWIECTSVPRYRRDVLRPAHKARLLEYDEGTRRVQISPLGIALVEDRLLGDGN